MSVTNKWSSVEEILKSKIYYYHVFPGGTGERQPVRVARAPAPDRPRERAGKRPPRAARSPHTTASGFPRELPIRAAFHAGH